MFRQCSGNVPVVILPALGWIATDAFCDGTFPEHFSANGR
jgi:hypothetical protein